MSNRFEVREMPGLINGSILYFVHDNETDSAASDNTYSEVMAHQWLESIAADADEMTEEEMDDADHWDLICRI